MKALTNPNVVVAQAHATPIATAPVAVTNEAPTAPAVVTPVSTNQLTRDLDSSKLPG